MKKSELQYEELLKYLNTYINIQYGSVSAFVESKDFSEKCGFIVGEKPKVHNYLSITKEGAKKVKSVPFLQKMFKALLGIEIQQRIIVERTAKIWSIQEIPDLPPLHKLN